MKKAITLAFIILYACKATCPNLNIELVNKFNYNLKIVKDFQNHKLIRVDEYRNALLYLSTTSGIMTNADYSSTLGYNSTEDYEKDIKLWKEWLEKNKCSSVDRIGNVSN